ncbi:hypothetical protein FRC07_006820 [Ceratobasidium sp. 392]|nr:hypothetical protein FRC07_006820 [Ceratobasidium sp. 392]
MSVRSPATAPAEVPSPTTMSPIPEGLNGTGIESGPSDPEQADDSDHPSETKSPISDILELPKLDGAPRRSTVKHRQETTESSGAPSVGGRRPRLGPQRKSSRYSQMTIDYFEKIPGNYNVLAGYFTWILLAGFVVGPGAQQAAQQVSTNERYQKLVTSVPLLAVSIACSGVGALGMIGLWIRWRTNYLWLIHKIFFPGFLNGLAGTLAAAVNIWAIQGGHFHFNAPAIITVSITGGATVICFTLTVIYQLLLMSVKRQHRRETGNDGDPEDPGLVGTASEFNAEDAKTSIFSSLFSSNN